MNEKLKNKILKLLVNTKILSKEQINDILSKEDIYRNRLLKTRGIFDRRGRQTQVDISIVDIIDSLKLTMPGSNKYVTEDVIMETIAKHLELPFIKIDPLKLNSDVVTKVIPKPYALKQQLIPIDLSGNNLTIATCNPFDCEGIDRIKQSTEYSIKRVVTTRSDIHKIITEFYGFKSSVAAAEEELNTTIDLGNMEQFVKLKSMSELDASDQHIVNAVEYLLHYSYAQRASDIHIEPKRNYSLIRFRIDGILHDIHKIPKQVHTAFLSRIKTLARMDISEKRRPQDGRIKTEQDGEEVELRVSTLPVSFGEKVVIRIFDPSILMQEVSQLGFEDREFNLFKTFMNAPYGLILVTGPTGSGKSTTLYSTLKSLARPGVNLTTIEDPVEMVSEEFNQTSIQPQIGITFASSLRTILRQDPDIIMVGEIRDPETAESAVQAALTGHLVLSTLHTNDAAGSISRLLNLGVPPFLINSTLIGVVAQRLMRKICENCTAHYYLSKDECRMLGIEHDKVMNRTVSVGNGCPLCRGTGYIGRTGIFEVMEITDKVKKGIDNKSVTKAIKRIAMEDGFIPLREHAIEKMLTGITTIDEIVRVAGLIP